MVFNVLNYSSRKRVSPRFKLPSLAVPEQSLSLKELLDRHTRGMALDAIAKTPIYDEENISSGINPATLDLVDIENMMRKNASKIDFLKNEKERKFSEARASKRKKEIDDEVEKRLNSQKSS